MQAIVYFGFLGKPFVMLSHWRQDSLVVISCIIYWKLLFFLCLQGESR